jgi:hypothetical protein
LNEPNILNIDENKSVKKIIIENCPTALLVMKKLVSQNFVNLIEKNASKCLDIYLKIEDISNPFSDEQIELMSTKIGNQKSILFSFESMKSGQRFVYWRITGQKYFGNLICDHSLCSREEIELLGTFVCDFLASSMECNHFGEFRKYRGKDN